MLLLNLFEVVELESSLQLRLLVKAIINGRVLSLSNTLEYLIAASELEVFQIKMMRRSAQRISTLFSALSHLSE
jgi:hypothetical protein